MRFQDTGGIRCQVTAYFTVCLQGVYQQMCLDPETPVCHRLISEVQPLIFISENISQCFTPYL